MRSAEEFNAVRQLIAANVNDCAIARQTDIARCTVRDWRRRPRLLQRTSSSAPPCVHDLVGLPAAAYGYLLGLYLGDGCISRHRRVWRLRITLDAKYPEIIARCRAAIDLLFPKKHAAVLRRSANCTAVPQCSKHWPCLFPQHGPGKKHHRPIRLEPWQQTLVEQATEQFVRGLIDSDGCRVVANDRGVRSVPYQIAVYRKEATARLDEFVGPKS